MKEFTVISVYLCGCQGNDAGCFGLGTCSEANVVTLSLGSRDIRDKKWIDTDWGYAMRSRIW